MSDDDLRKRPTSPALRRPTQDISVYRTDTSGWQLAPLPGCIVVEADLMVGYQVGETPDGLRIVDAAGDLPMTADEAVQLRI